MRYIVVVIGRGGGAPVTQRNYEPHRSGPFQLTHDESDDSHIFELSCSKVETIIKHRGPFGHFSQ